MKPFQDRNDVASTIQDLSEAYLQQSTDSYHQQQYVASHQDKFMFRMIDFRGLNKNKFYRKDEDGGVLLAFDEVDHPLDPTSDFSNSQTTIFTTEKDGDVKDSGFLTLDGTVDDEMVNEYGKKNQSATSPRSLLASQEGKEGELNAFNVLNSNIKALIESSLLMKTAESSESREIDKIVSAWRSTSKSITPSLDAGLQQKKLQDENEPNIQSIPLQILKNSLKDAISRMETAPRRGASTENMDPEYLQDIRSILNFDDSDSFFDSDQKDRKKDETSTIKILIKEGPSTSLGSSSPANLNMKMLAVARQWLLNWLGKYRGGEQSSSPIPITFPQLCHVIEQSKSYIMRSVSEINSLTLSELSNVQIDGYVSSIISYVVWLIPKLRWVSSRISLIRSPLLSFKNGDNGSVDDSKLINIKQLSIFDTFETKIFRACLIFKENYDSIRQIDNRLMTSLREIIFQQQEMSSSTQIAVPYNSDHIVERAMQSVVVLLSPPSSINYNVVDNPNKFIGMSRLIQTISSYAAISSASKSNWKLDWTSKILDDAFPTLVRLGLIGRGSQEFKNFAFLCATALILSNGSPGQNISIEHAIQIIADGVESRKSSTTTTGGVDGVPSYKEIGKGSDKYFKLIYFRFFSQNQARLEFETWAKERAQFVETTRIKANKIIEEVNYIEQVSVSYNSETFIDQNPVSKSSQIQTFFRVLSFPESESRICTPLEMFISAKVSSDIPFIHLVEDQTNVAIRNIFHPTSSFFTSFYQLALAAEENGIKSARHAYIPINAINEALFDKNRRRLGPVKIYQLKNPSSSFEMFEMPKESVFYGLPSGSFVTVVDISQKRSASASFGEKCNLDSGSGHISEVNLSDATSSQQQHVVVILKPEMSPLGHQLFSLQFRMTFDDQSSQQPPSLIEGSDASSSLDFFENLEDVQSNAILNTVSQIVQQSFQSSLVIDDSASNMSKKSAKGFLAVSAARWLNMYMIHLASLHDPIVSKYIWMNESKHSISEYSHRGTFQFIGGSFTIEPLRTAHIASRNDIDDWIIISFFLNKASDVSTFPKFLAGILGCIHQNLSNLYSHLPGNRSMTAISLREARGVTIAPINIAKISRTKSSKIKDIRSSIPKELLSTNFVTECQCEKSPVVIAPDEADAWEAMGRQSFNFRKSFLATHSMSSSAAKELIARSTLSNSQQIKGSTNSAADKISATFVCPRDKSRFPAIRVSHKSTKVGGEKFVCCFSSQQRAETSTFKSLTSGGKIGSDHSDQEDDDGDDGDDDAKPKNKKKGATTKTESTLLSTKALSRLRGDYLVMKPMPVLHQRVGAVPIVIHSFLTGLTRAYGHHFVRLGIPQGPNSLITSIRTIVQSPYWPDPNYLKSGMEYNQMSPSTKWILPTPEREVTDETILEALISFAKQGLGHPCFQEFPSSCYHCSQTSLASYLSSASLIDSQVVIRALEELFDINIVILVTDRLTDWCSIGIEIPQHARAWLPPGPLPGRRPTIILLRLQTSSGQTHYEPIISRGEILRLSKIISDDDEAISARLPRVKKDTAFFIFHEHISIAFWKVACRVHEPVRIYSHPIFESRRQYPGLTMMQSLEDEILGIFEEEGGKKMFKISGQGIDYYGKVFEILIDSIIELSSDIVKIIAFVEPLPPIRKISNTYLSKRTDLPIILKDLARRSSDMIPFPVSILASPFREMYKSISQGVVSIPFGQTIMTLTLRDNLISELIKSPSRRDGGRRSEGTPSSSPSLFSTYMERYRASTLTLQLLWWMRSLFRAIMAAKKYKQQSTKSIITFDEWFDICTLPSLFEESRYPEGIPTQFPSIDQLYHHLTKSSESKSFSASSIILAIGKIAKKGVWPDAFTSEGVFIGASERSLSHIRSFLKRIEIETEGVEFELDNPLGSVPMNIYGLHSSKAQLFGSKIMASSQSFPQNSCCPSGGQRMVLVFDSIRDYNDWKLYSQSQLERLNDAVSRYSDICTSDEVFLRRGTKDSSALILEVDSSTLGSVYQSLTSQSDMLSLQDGGDSFYVTPSRSVYRFKSASSTNDGHNDMTTGDDQKIQNFLFSFSSPHVDDDDVDSATTTGCSFKGKIRLYHDPQPPPVQIQPKWIRKKFMSS